MDSGRSASLSQRVGSALGPADVHARLIANAHHRLDESVQHFFGLGFRGLDKLALWNQQGKIIGRRVEVLIQQHLGKIGGGEAEFLGFLFQGDNEFVAGAPPGECQLESVGA